MRKPPPVPRYIRDKFQVNPRKPTTRICLGCGRKFRSDTYHLCPECRKNLDAYHAPVDWRGGIVE